MEDYKQRVKEEKKDLDTKIQKLQAFIESDGVVFNTLKKEEQSAQREQLRIMYAYSQILKIRINRF